MHAEYIERAFAEIGARFKVEEAQRGKLSRQIPYSVDISADRRGQFFLLRAQVATMPVLDVQVLQKSKPERHLLLLVKDEQIAEKNRFLCGYDEREWFVAATPGGASSIAAAKEALKPEIVAQRQAAVGLTRNQRLQRRNKAFIRQGEWFFLPEPGLVVPETRIHRHEPIFRSGGKPHYVEELYRAGGELVFVNRQYPLGLTRGQLEEVLSRRKELRRQYFVQRRRGMTVYGRGKVTHRDHHTVVLHEWHLIVMNEEYKSPARQNLAFLD